ncbi:MAG: restriction endonuclease subunit S, partial [Acetobacterium sp.]|nr:restriction endonuclease subunit S [Acetobacterium sp.]
MNNNQTKFKETEIGPIPEDWDAVRLEELVDFTNGKTSPARFDSGKFPVYGANGVIGFSEKTNSVKEAIIVGRVGAYCGSIYFSNNESWVTDNAIKGKAKAKTDPRFLYYLLNTLGLNERAGGSGQPLINQSILNSIIVRRPSDVEQKQIAEILSSLDDKIELNRQVNANLEKMASALFKRWFVDFEFPDENGKPYKSSGGKMVDSELGPMPEGWKVGIIDDLVAVGSGFAFNSNMFTKDGKYGLVTIKNVQDGYFINKCTDSIDDIPVRMPDYCKIKDGDILLSLTGNVGRVCLVYGGKYLLNQRVAILIPRDVINKTFIYTLFRQFEFQSRLVGISRGTAQQNLSPIETKSLEITVPEKSVLNSFG